MLQVTFHLNFLTLLPSTAHPKTPDTTSCSDLQSIVEIMACAPTAAAARALLPGNQSGLDLPGMGDAASAALKLYERLPFLTAAAARVDAEALHLWRVTGLSSR